MQGRQYPIVPQGTFLKNTRAKNTLTPRADTGYQTGARLGTAGKAKSWEIAYFYKWLETDATVADAADSDFGDGGTNRVGHIFWVGYAPKDWMSLRAKAFVTDTLDRSFPTVAGVTSPTATTNLDKAINRLQLDMVVKF